MLIDMKNAKLKDISNKQTLAAYRQIVLELQKFYPEMVHKIFVVNSPLFLETVYED